MLLFLPVHEDLERALNADQDLDELRHGLHAVYKGSGEILDRLGCHLIPTVGEDFDPIYHEAVLAEESDLLGGGLYGEGEEIPMKVWDETKEFSPKQISAFILQKLKRGAEELLCTRITKAVTTCTA